MPLMDDFLELGFEFASRNTDSPGNTLPYWQMMARLETVHSECGVWGGPPSNMGMSGGSFSGMPFGESVGEPEYGVLAKDLLAGHDTDIFKKAATTYLKKLSNQEFLKSQERRRTNIEWALSQAEEYALRTDDDKPFIAVKNYILWLLGKLEEEAGAVAGGTPLDHLCDTIQKRGYTRFTRFVSFNYDVLLERALQRQNPTDPNRGSGKTVWNPHENYGVGFERHITCEDLRNGRALKPKHFPHIDKGHVTVLKPHGSLYWFRQRNGDRWSLPLLDMENPKLPILPTPGDSYSKLIAKYLGPSSDGLEPILIPPSPTKALDGTVLWQTWQNIDRELQECASVVVIGWNMPATDGDVRARIADAIAKRGNNPIKRLLVCDTSKSDIFYHRFVAAFRPDFRIEPWREGFTERFVQERLVPEIMAKQR